MLEPSDTALLTITEEVIKPNSVVFRIVIETETVQDYLKWRPREPASFWRENAIAVVIRRENVSGEDKLSNVISFIILRLEEGLTFFNKIIVLTFLANLVFLVVFVLESNIERKTGAKLSPKAVP